MTYNEIVKQALTHLEFGEDEDAASAYNERFMMYANEAVRIIADDIKMTDTIDIEYPIGGNTFSTSDIENSVENKHVTKICDVHDKTTKRPYRFYSSDEYGKFVVEKKPEASITVRYRYMPVYNTDGDAEPGIPEAFHSIIWYYIVHCHENSRASMTKGYSYNHWLVEFERQRKSIARSYGAREAYQWKNLPWHTGEI